LQASYLSRLLEYADSILQDRRRSVEIYKGLIEECLKPKVCFFEAPPGVDGNGYLLVLTTEKPPGNEIEEGLKKKGIGCGRVYPETIDRQVPAQTALRFSSLDRSRQFCRRVINLPLFYGISDSECRESVLGLKKVLEESEDSHVEVR